MRHSLDVTNISVHCKVLEIKPGRKNFITKKQRSGTRASGELLEVPSCLGVKQSLKNFMSTNSFKRSSMLAHEKQ